MTGETGGIQSRITFFENMGEASTVQDTTKNDEASAAAKTKVQTSSPSAGMKVSTSPQGKGMGAAKSDSVVKQSGTFEQIGEQSVSSQALVTGDRKVSANLLTQEKGASDTAEKPDAKSTAAKTNGFRPTIKLPPGSQRATRMPSREPPQPPSQSTGGPPPIPPKPRRKLSSPPKEPPPIPPKPQNYSLGSPPNHPPPETPSTGGKVDAAEKKNIGTVLVEGEGAGADVEDLTRDTTSGGVREKTEQWEAQEEGVGIEDVGDLKDPEEVKAFNLPRELNPAEQKFSNRWKDRAQMAKQGSYSASELREQRTKYLGELKTLLKDGHVGRDFYDGIKKNIYKTKVADSRPLAKASYNAAKKANKRQGDFFSKFNKLNDKFGVAKTAEGAPIDYTPKVKEMQRKSAKLSKVGRFITKGNAFKKLAKFDELKAKSYDAIGIQLDQYKEAALHTIANRDSGGKLSQLEKDLNDIASELETAKRQAEDLNLDENQAKELDQKIDDLTAEQNRIKGEVGKLLKAGKETTEYKTISSNAKIIHEYTDPDGNVDGKSYREAFNAFESTLQEVLPRRIA